MMITLLNGYRDVDMGTSFLFLSRPRRMESHILLLISWLPVKTTLKEQQIKLDFRGKSVLRMCKVKIECYVYLMWTKREERDQWINLFSPSF